MKDVTIVNGDGAATSSTQTNGRSAASRMSRRSFLRLASMAAGGLTLAACSGPIPIPTPRTGSKAHLVYQDWRTEWFPPMAQQMLEEFHASHPNIRVFYTPDPENLEDRMLADMQAGTAADVFQGCCTHFPIWAQKGYALDLRPYVQADLDRATLDDWDAAQFKALSTRDGRQFGLPKYHGALALYYNRDMFDSAGVSYPDATWSYDDYLDAMKLVTRYRTGSRGTKPWGSMVDVSWDRLQVHVNAWGGHFVDPADPSLCRMAEPPALAALSWLRDRMWDDRVMATFSDVENVGTSQAFSAGWLAMVEDGSWALKDILARAAFRVGVAPMPAGPARRVTLASTDGFGIYAGTRHPEAAWELVKFLIGKDYGRAMARASFLQPARASLVEEWASFVREEFPDRAGDVDIAAFADGHLKGYSVTAEIFPNMAEAARIATAAWDQILSLGLAPVEEMMAACRQIQQSQQAGVGGGGSWC